MESRLEVLQSRIRTADPRNILSRGQERGEITKDKTVNELTHLYALCERGILYDSCLSRGDYSLAEYGDSVMPLMMGKLREEAPTA